MNIKPQQVTDIVSKEQGINKQDLANRLSGHQRSKLHFAYDAIHSAQRKGMVRVDTQVTGRGIHIDRMYTIADHGLESEIVLTLRKHPNGMTTHQLTQAVMPGHKGHTVSSVATKMAKKGRISKRYSTYNGKKEWMYYTNNNVPTRKKRKKKQKERRK